MLEEQKKIMEIKPTCLSGKFTEREREIALKLINLSSTGKQLEFNFEGDEDERSSD